MQRTPEIDAEREQLTAYFQSLGYSTTELEDGLGFHLSRESSSWPYATIHRMCDERGWEVTYCSAYAEEVNTMLLTRLLKDAPIKMPAPP